MLDGGWGKDMIENLSVLIAVETAVLRDNVARYARLAVLFWREANRLKAANDIHDQPFLERSAA